MGGLKIDLSMLTGRLRVGRGAAGTDDEAAGALVEAERRAPAGDAITNPLVTRKLRKCTIACTGHVVGIADGLRIAQQNAGGYDLALLRLRLELPGGETECCVRQFVPGGVRRVLAPGESSVMVLAHETDPVIAIVDWRATGERIGARLDWVVAADQYDWPGQADWPATGAIEVREPFGSGRHRRKLERQRQAWTAARARLVSGSTRGSRSDDREVWKLELDLEEPGGSTRRVALKSRVPSLAIAKLFAFKEGGSRLGGLATAVNTVARLGAPVSVLVSPKAEVVVDWEATLAFPELQTPDAL